MHYCATHLQYHPKLTLSLDTYSVDSCNVGKKTVTRQAHQNHISACRCER